MHCLYTLQVSLFCALSVQLKKYPALAPAEIRPFFSYPATHGPRRRIRDQIYSLFHAQLCLLFS